MAAAVVVHGGERAAEGDANELPLERLEAEICELAGHLAAGECRWLLLLSEFDRREGWSGWGFQSCAHWVSYRCGLGLQAAREKLRVARRLGELPLVRAAFAGGELSYSKVRAVCRVARPETEATLLEMARYATTAQLEEIVRTYRKVTGREELRDANDRHDARFARWYWDDDGSLVLSARLTPEDGAVVLAALEAGREAAESSENPRTRAHGDSAESLLAETKRADAFVAMAKLAVAAPADATPPVAEIVIVDRATLRGDRDEGLCHIDGGVALPPETARRLACDAIVVAMVEAADGTPLDVGRKRRTPPAALRRALRRRDRCCRFPGCGSRRFLHAHHIVHWINGGKTMLVNLILLCSRHHRLIHEGGYRIETPGDHVFTFLDPVGRQVPESPPLTP
ncbi:MAG: HNH endonuclease, partial [Actinobacteria bacterium]|nr:HNH endonuclease [Actinomycetota bacterium]